jgi:hypothetical protein
MSGFRRIGVDIGYRYTAGGRTHEGNRYRFQFVLERQHMRSRDVQAIVGRYRPGDPIRVSVNPSDPADSVMDPEPDFDSTIPFGLGLFLVLLGVGKVADSGAAQPVKRRSRSLTAKVLAVAGAAMILYGAIVLYRGLRSIAWPTAQGKIVYSHARSARTPETLLWYEYFVNQQRFMASNYRNGGNVTPFDSVAEAAAKRYPVGRVVTVYYDPSDPAQALLEPGVWWGNFMLPLFGALTLGAAWVAKKYAEIMASRRGSDV